MTGNAAAAAAAYVDLKKAFDSVHRETLWDLLCLRGIPAARIIGLLTGLYSGTVSAVKCGGGVSSFSPVNTGVRQGCVLAPSLFNTCMDWVLGRVVEQSHCGASVGNTKITDLVFADDAAIFAESLEVLVMALEALHEEVKPLGLKVSWAKTKVQVFGGVLDETVQSVHACGEDIEILKRIKLGGKTRSSSHFVKPASSSLFSLSPPPLGPRPTCSRASSDESSIRTNCA